jgi:hypothetical protein
MRQFLVVGSLLVSLACGACGGAKPAVVITPLTPEQAKAFDRGIDFVATLEGLEGRWRDDWDKDLQTRVGMAELIATVTIKTLRTDTDPGQRVTYRLVAHVDRELVGHEGDKEVELPVRQDEPGYSSVHDNITRIADKQYVAYVRSSADGPIWHLSPASPEVLTETESQITQLNRVPKKDSGERVIVHTN